MSLRVQLLALGALTLLLPWAGIEMVRQVEVSLRLALEDSLLASARANIVVTGLAFSEALRRRESEDAALAEPLYLHSLTRPPLLDGFASDWQYPRDQTPAAFGARAETLADGSRLWLGVNSSYVYLFIDVVDDDVVYQGVPGEAPHGDRIVVRFGADANARRSLLLATSAPGPFRAQRTPGGPSFMSEASYEDRVHGAWQETESGYAIEARLPLSLMAGAIGIGIVDSDARGESARLAASTSDQSAVPNVVKREIPALNRILEPFTGGDARLRIFDADGWVLADSGPVPEIEARDPTAEPTLIERFFRYVLRRSDPEYETQERTPGRIGDAALLGAVLGEEATAWYRRGTDVSAIVAAAVPIDSGNLALGALLFERASDPIVTTTNQAMMRVMGTAVLIIVIGSIGALAYASFLSVRIGRLARAAESALGPGGEIVAKLPGTKGRDEIADLSRSFESLLGRLSDYTEYLKSLKSKLSHELRTPLAVVSTSVENLEQEPGTPASRDYVERLRQGADRLESILQAMTAATRVEQAIADSTREVFDLGAVIHSCMSAYSDVYKTQAFTTRLPENPVRIRGGPELIAQMLDKLIDNAVSFAAEGTTIEVELSAQKDTATLSVTNRGPLLPEAMRHQLFDSLVSVRSGHGDKPHLGLGLYIVTLVAKFHGGRVGAENLADGSGVRISVELPCGDTRST